MMKKRKDKNLAEGEVTGHAHAVKGRAEVFDLDESGDTRRLVATKAVTVTHEEHKTIGIPAGEYLVYRQQEIDPDTEEARQVSD
jgi:hypothetical protein